MLSKPAAPNIQATANGGELEITWDSIPGAQYYTVGWINWTEGQPVHADGGDWLSFFNYTTVEGSQTSYTVKGLDGGDNYYANIRATDVAGITAGRFGGSYSTWSDWSSSPAQPAGQHGEGFCPITGLPLPPGGYLSIGSAAVFGSYSLTMTGIETPATAALIDADGNVSNDAAPSGRRWLMLRTQMVNNLDFAVNVENGKDYVVGTDAGNAFSWNADVVIEPGTERENVGLLFDVPQNAAIAVFAVRPLIALSGENAPQLYEIQIPAPATSATLAPASNTPLSGEELTRHVKPALGQIVATNSRGETSGGTGFIVGTNGIMVTNRHVVDDAQTIEVRMNTLDGRTERLTGTVLGRGILADLAAVQLPSGRTYSALPLADSDAVSGLDDVTAWGYPAGSISDSYPTITRGIISSKGIYGDLRFLQTDAAINPGNSGGPLVDQYGNVVGVNTLKTVHEAIDNQGFSIASNEVKARLNGLITGGPSTATYRNLRYNYGYSVNIPRGSYLDEEGQYSTTFAPYHDRGFTFVDTYTLAGSFVSSPDKLEAFAQWRWNRLLELQQERNWSLLNLDTIRSVGTGSSRSYRLAYRFQAGTQYCVQDVVEMITLSSSRPTDLGFSLASSVCEQHRTQYGSERDGIINSFRW